MEFVGVPLETMSDELDPLERDAYKLQRRLRRDNQNAELKKELREIRKKIAAIKGRAGDALKRFEKPKTHDVNGYASYTLCSDGKFVYTAVNGEVLIIKSWPVTESKVIARLNLGKGAQPRQLFLNGNKLVVLSNIYEQIPQPKAKKKRRRANPYNY